MGTISEVDLRVFSKRYYWSTVSVFQSVREFTCFQGQGVVAVFYKTKVAEKVHSGGK